MSGWQEEFASTIMRMAANDEDFFVPNRSGRSSNYQQFQIESAHKLAVSVPVLPACLQEPVIEEIFRLLRTGLSSGVAA